MPKISIITPSFNQAQFLEATIESILSQNYPNLEYIIIDGGSNDGSIDIIKKYEKYLSFWCSEPDAGQYDALNKGFCHSKGEIMSWLNSDDMYLPWALRTVADIMISLPDVEWLTTLSPGGWDYHGFCSGFGSVPGYSREAFLDGCYLPYKNNSNFMAWIQQESTFWRRSLWDRSGGLINSNLKLAGDFDLWSRFYLHADLCATPSPLGGFRHQHTQRSRDINKYIEESLFSLLIARESVNWKPNFSQSKLLLTAKRVPKLKTLIKSKWGYQGKKIIRKKSDYQDGYWEVETYRF
ncbi:glycosyltransferase [Synechocystis sp. PCC 7338]|nr:glycosyltransferase [Synechocystis sp. PCC 7338]